MKVETCLVDSLHHNELSEQVYISTDGIVSPELMGSFECWLNLISSLYLK